MNEVLFKKDGAYANFEGGAGQDSIITVVVTNNMANACKVLMFNGIFSFDSIVQNNIYGVEVFTPFIAETRNAPNLNNVIYYDALGKQIIQNAAGEKVTIETVGENVPSYRDMCNVTKANRSYEVNRFKLSATTFAQIQQGNIGLTRWSDNGLKVSNSEPLLTNLSVMQQTQTTIDVPTGFTLDLNTGLSLNILPAQSVTFNFFVK